MENFFESVNLKHVNPSESVRRLNPELFGVGGLRATKPQPSGQRAPAPAHAPQARSPGRVVICLVGLRRVTMDDDNFVGGCKWLRDAIAASLGVDDGDKRLHWEYGQVQTSGQQGVIVMIGNAS